MNDYISKQKVLDYLNGYLHSLGEDADTLFNRGQRRALTNSIQDILAVKAAEVQPVKHGKWVLFDKDCVGRAFYCSNCRKVTTTDDFESSPLERDEYFCSRCGARMIKDGEQND